MNHPRQDWPGDLFDAIGAVQAIPKIVRRMEADARHSNWRLRARGDLSNSGNRYSNIDRSKRRQRQDAVMGVMSTEPMLSSEIADLAVKHRVFKGQKSARSTVFLTLEQLLDLGVAVKEPRPKSRGGFSNHHFVWRLL